MGKFGGASMPPHTGGVMEGSDNYINCAVVCRLIWLFAGDKA
jgi:hypothetical protein